MPFRRIVIGISESHEAAPALAFAWWAGRGAAETVVVATSHRLSGTPLVRVAADYGADLLLVPARHRLLGDPVARSLHRASCAMAVLPPDVGGEPPERIVFAHDGTAGAGGALDLAALLAAEHALPLSIVHVVDPLVEGSPLPTLPPATELLEGAPEHELVHQTGPYDLLVMASRADGALGRLLLGSTALHVARHAKCPVLILPRCVRVPERVRARRPLELVEEPLP